MTATFLKIATVNEAIEAGHPDAFALATVLEFARADARTLTRAQQELRAALLATACDEAQGWLDEADERAFGEAAEAGMMRARERGLLAAD